MTLVKRFVLAVVAALCLIPAASFAQDNYPTRPIRLIVGFGAGSSADVVARVISHKLSDLLGQSVVVENKPGAGSMIATDYVARTSKDGYTLLMATIAATINTTMMSNKDVNFEKDLAPITLIGSTPEILVVNPKLGVSDVKGLIAMAKEKPNGLLYGASGVGSGPRLATELFKQMAGIKMTAVLYPGSAQTLTDLIAGRIQVMFSPAPTVVGFIGKGTVKALATTGEKRAGIAPNLPTISEAGLPGFDTGLWFGLVAPAGTPDAVIEKVSKATNEALKDPTVAKLLHNQGMDIAGGSPAEFGRFIKKETDRWGRIVKELGITRKKKK